MADLYTDMGADFALTNTETGEPYMIGRYGVWENGQVIDTFFDLDKLKEKYGELPLHSVDFPLNLKPVGDA